jgi:hypothetical protein
MPCTAILATVSGRTLSTSFIYNSCKPFELHPDVHGRLSNIGDGSMPLWPAAEYAIARANVRRSVEARGRTTAPWYLLPHLVPLHAACGTEDKQGWDDFWFCHLV